MDNDECGTVFKHDCLVNCQWKLKTENGVCHVTVIARHMRWGRQEDAHEFLRYVIDALQRSALFGLSRYVDFFITCHNQ